ncbi:hypothetical protein RRG08_035993 [Elysia crispata]|uniref:Uncharacterized protein n=1 Tax=Elysia crispata TaxID=231223 RepID=A0AAE1E472_9GAST|nr:hypothetical protein RRG08_035993 [Elysia crispata]
MSVETCSAVTGRATTLRQRMLLFTLSDHCLTVNPSKLDWLPENISLVIRKRLGPSVDGDISSEVCHYVTERTGRSLRDLDLGYFWIPGLSRSQAIFCLQNTHFSARILLISFLYTRLSCTKQLARARGCEPGVYIYKVSRLVAGQNAQARRAGTS